MVVHCIAAASDKFFLVPRVGVQQHDVPRINCASCVHACACPHIPVLNFASLFQQMFHSSLDWPYTYYVM